MSQLLWQSTTESKCHVTIIAEQYRVPPENGNWVVDNTQIAAIQVVGSLPIQELIESSYDGFVVVQLLGTSKVDG